MQKQTFAGRRRLRDLILIALFAALLSISAWIAIPFGSVPITMQSFAVLCTVGLLGGRRGVLAILLYLALGLVGLPVFSGMTGGFPALLGPSGGFLIGFLAMGLTVWLSSALFRGRGVAFTVGAALGTLICYLFGVGWFMAVYAGNGEPIEFLSAITVCVLPYLLPDFCKLVLAFSVTRAIQKHLSI